MSINLDSSENFGFGFLPSDSIHNEYYLRYEQNPKGSYRNLNKNEIKLLELNGNTSSDWNYVLVEEPFLPELIKNNIFAGLVRISSMQDVLLKYHDFVVRAGITNSTIISCDIGSVSAIHSCSYLSHYIIEDNVILSQIDEMSTTNHAKFGEGIVKDGELEKVRIKIDVINESGGRDVFPFRKMLIPDAFIWAKFRGDAVLISKLEKLTQNECSPKCGYYGVVEHGSVIKSCRIIKDVYVGKFSYIKGANKLKNLTILSSEDEPSQIGEGVELVNGIIGYGSHIFYGVKAVRFVMASHCTLKYGARLIHSILGDNSTISCCEVLNALIFPFHEQHHNNSFLIASMIMGQSNMAAGATVGSNHNTRGNDGEIIAGRGFWPGLSITLKHNCKFASFVLIAKGIYSYELNIPFPFSLIMDNQKEGVLEIMPAYYWMYNMYSLERNVKKFLDRDKRQDKTLKIETDYLAPDTAIEILKAIELLNDIINKAKLEDVVIKEDLYDIVYTSPEYIENSKRHVKFLKIAKAISSYKEMLIYYGIKTLSQYFIQNNIEPLQFISSNHFDDNLFEWVNVGGQLMPKTSLNSLIEKIKNDKLKTWDEIHNEYARISKTIEKQKAHHAFLVLSKLLNKNIEKDSWNALIDEAINIRKYIEKQVFVTKQKDYNSFFREITYENMDEMNAVLKKLEDNPVIKEAKQKTAEYIALFEKARIK
ncbi:MAG: DUF4954 family protein [Treponema sp.]